MSEDSGRGELTQRQPDAVEPTQDAVTPVPEGEQRDVERFSSATAAHSVELTEERSARIVRQSANARNAAFLAILLITVFIPVYWFYEAGIPALGAEGRMARETRLLNGEEQVEVAPVTEPGTPDAPRTVALTLTDALEILDDDGRAAAALAVSEGETIRFEIDNTAGFPHNFYLGGAAELAADQTTGLAGVPAWSSGTRTFDWVAQADDSLRFACTVPGHYSPMNGPLVFGP